MSVNIFEKIKEFFKRKIEDRRHHMSVLMILYISWRNLKTGKMRSVLTIGGVALGIGIIMFLLCLGFGIQEMIVNEVTKNNPKNVIDINNGNLDSFVTINDEMIQKIMGIAGVTQVERRINTGGKAKLGDSQTDVVIYGANKEYFDVSKIYYKSGQSSYVNNEEKAIVSERFSRLLGFDNPLDVIGKTLSYDVVLSKDIGSNITEEKVVSENQTEVIGIIEGAETPFIYIPFDVIKNKFGMDLAQTGKVVFANPEDSSNIQQQIQQMGLIAESINDLIKEINSFFNTVRIFLVIFGIIIMSISVMGMLNTLSVSLLQRTKEIGILKTLGTKRSDIFRMFILESVIISFLGGILGAILGYSFALFINYILIILGKKWGVELGFFVYIPHSFTIAIVSFVIFMGLITGMMPAYRASRIHSLEALRYE